MQIIAHVARPNAHRRTSWLVWLMAGILLALDLGHSPYVEAPLEARLALLGFRLAILGALAQSLWGRHPPAHRLARVATRLFGLCAAGAALALQLEVAGSPSGAERLETGAASAVAVLEPCVSLAMAGALVLGLLRLISGAARGQSGGWRQRALFSSRRRHTPRSMAKASAPHTQGGAMQAATHSETDVARPDGPPRAPGAVWLVAATLVLNLVSAVSAVFSTDGHSLDLRLIAFSCHLGLLALLGWGLWRRHPLVHRLYVVVSSLGFLSSALTLLIASTRGQPIAAVVESCASLAVLGLLLFALQRPSARAWFGLQCPQCGSQRIKAKSLGMRQLACKACDHGWDRRAPHAVDATAFD